MGVKKPVVFICTGFIPGPLQWNTCNNSVKKVWTITGFTDTTKFFNLKFPFSSPLRIIALFIPDSLSPVKCIPCIFSTMNQSSFLSRKIVIQYRAHILVFLVAFFIAITLAHPAFFVNDEWITANQLSQLHDGKQLMFNEGKYGTYENGTASVYFSLKDNILGYSLFLPLISRSSSMRLSGLCGLIP